ncbi:6967_t:CDS:2, partial [Rhizophagus irregularis]
MNPTIITSKPIVIVASEVTEKPVTISRKNGLHQANCKDRRTIGYFTSQSHPPFFFGFIAGSNNSIYIIEHEFVGFPGFSVNSEVTMITGLESHPQFLFGFIADGNSSSIHIIEHEFVGLPGFSVSSEVTMITGLEVMIVVGFI